jgi:purine-binding chemotaxis protein CheW
MNNETRSVLKMRAAAMALETEPAIKDSDAIEVITFTLASETYGLESEFIREVCPLKDYTPLPGVPPFILGIIQVRGRIIPIVDLKNFFNIPAHGIGELNKVIILQNEHMEFGILADIVLGSQSIGLDEICPVPPTVSGIGEEYLRGVTKGSLILLNGGKLLSDKSLIVNEEVTRS